MSQPPTLTHSFQQVLFPYSHIAYLFSLFLTAPQEFAPLPIFIRKYTTDKMLAENQFLEVWQKHKLNNIFEPVGFDQSFGNLLTVALQQFLMIFIQNHYNISQHFLQCGVIFVLILLVGEASSILTVPIWKFPTIISKQTSKKLQKSFRIVVHPCFFCKISIFRQGCFQILQYQINNRFCFGREGSTKIEAAQAAPKMPFDIQLQIVFHHGAYDSEQRLHYFREDELCAPIYRPIDKISHNHLKSRTTPVADVVSIGYECGIILQRHHAELLKIWDCQYYSIFDETLNELGEVEAVEFMFWQ